MKTQKTSTAVRKRMAEMNLSAVGVANFLSQCNESLKARVTGYEDQIERLTALGKGQRQAIEELSSALARVSECLQQLSKR